MTIHVDLDGVIFDFDRAAINALGCNPRDYEEHFGSDLYWRKLHEMPTFYRDMPLLPDAHELIAGIRALGHEPVFNSGTPKMHRERVTEQKGAACDEFFPEIKRFFGPSRDKRDHAKPGDIIIDDWPQYRDRWIEMGGLWIMHTSAAQSLAELRLIFAEQLHGYDR